MDEGVGRIVAALTPAQRENTLIVFVSDNGGERFSNNWPFVGGKMDLLEGGIRVPQIACWPARIASGQHSDWPTLTMDWMPTMLAAAGVEPQAGYPLDGVDLSPLLSDAGWSPERTLYWRMKHREQAACVAGRWKYLRIEGHEYLFDVVADGRERANLAKRDPHRLATLRRQWQEWNETMPAIPDDAQVHLLWNERDMPRPTH
jgi:arylsulfatase A-like enzyme